MCEFKVSEGSLNVLVLHVYGNLVVTLQGELLYVFCSMSFIFAHGKSLGCGESKLRKQMQ